MKIKLKDYERIYKTINSIVKNENADPTVACTFFSFYGAHILREHYKMDAQPLAGMCFYHMGGNNDVLSFAKLDGDNFSSDIDAFHCWVVVDGWLIDFMAPAFSDIKTGKVPLKAKMMQKPISEMAESLNHLTKEGDFYFDANPEVLENRMEYLASSLAYSDLADICSQWYKKPPKKMNSAIQIKDGKGQLNSIALQGNSVIGAW
ncbi:DUF2026 domain-containing protein [Paraglaciecola psychrophila]|uniref:DUF2026 domain-containing protein n=1 Tax=Paraglaciecola psychrophila 170 TaxID=1129794 RepID=K7A9W9_9ALTE|nr:DUF2026 domain-containing protein [Paraglaciecola psychrophila]AGH45846.1 hypothetical protein C427_3738 [Paraglaciecola psychrophila 170]GAC37533.1 hypothetical protein GPSY_1909 [Paraglaciecola psychrophila 170]